jgi:regulator of sirC expression with transglutaminase-like and TPR domain
MQEDLINLGLIDDEEIILDEAALDLALLDHPDRDDDPYLDVLSEISEHLGAVAYLTKPRAQAEHLAQVLGGEFGFSGDSETYDDPANADLIRVIERRRGLPVSLSILYVAAARRMGWTANVLDVPGHVLVLVGEDVDPVVIDPFRGGRFVAPDQLASMVQAMNPERTAAVSHVAAMPNRAVLVRLLLNQATRAETSGKGRRALTLYQRMTVMAPEYGHAWWERARLELVDGDADAARDSLTAMLEVTRDADLRKRITDVLTSLPRHSR